VMVRQHGGRDDTLPHLTHAASASERAGYFNTILIRHASWIATRPDVAIFLLRRQIKMLARARDTKAAYQLFGSPLAKPYRLDLILYYALELFLAAVRRSKG
jgi:hypothetical protein